MLKVSSQEWSLGKEERGSSSRLPDCNVRDVLEGISCVNLSGKLANVT